MIKTGKSVALYPTRCFARKPPGKIQTQIPDTFPQILGSVEYSRGLCCSRKYTPPRTLIAARNRNKAVAGRKLIDASAKNRNRIVVVKQITDTPLLKDRMYGM